MADEKEDIEKVTSATKEEMEMYKSALKEIEKNTKNLRLSQKALVMAAKEHYEAYVDIKDIAESISEVETEIKKKQEELNKARKKGAAIDKIRHKASLDSLKLQKRRLKAAQSVYETEKITLNNKIKIIKNLNLEVKAREKILGVELKLKNLKKGKPAATKKEKEFLDMLQDSIIGGAQAAFEMSKNLSNLSAETVAFSLLIPELGVEQFGEKYVGFGKSADDAFRKIMKAGISFSRSGYEGYISALDPISSATSDFNFISKKFQDEMITNTNLTGEDMANAAIAAKNNISLFRRDLIETSLEARSNAAATLNLIANVNKLGVAHEDTAKAIDFFTRGLKQTPQAARESVRSLTNIAHSLDLNVATVFKEFGTTLGDIAQYGADQLTVFAGLQAQYRATGVEVDTLSKIAGKLDTFKGAAEVAQKFNAVLGGTVLSVTDLVHAEPAEKINELRKAFARSGTTFEDSHRRIKSMAAEFLGIDVPAATKLFGSEEDFFTIRKQMDTSAEDTETLRTRLEETLDVGERATRAQQSLAAASTKIMERAYRTADNVASTMLDVYVTSRSETESAEEALISYIAQVKTLGFVSQQAKSKMGGIAKIAGAAAVLKTAFEAGMSTEQKNKMLIDTENLFGVDIGTPEEGKYFTPDNRIGTSPTLAEGGIVPKTPGGQEVVVAEGGQDEAVIPLNKLYDMLAGNNSKTAELVLQNVTLQVQTDTGQLVTLGTINQKIEGFLNSTLTGKPSPEILV
jgi:hypothetical protein